MFLHQIMTPLSRSEQRHAALESPSKASASHLLFYSLPSDLKAKSLCQSLCHAGPRHTPEHSAFHCSRPSFVFFPMHLEALPGFFIITHRNTGSCQDGTEPLVCQGQYDWQQLFRVSSQGLSHSPSLIHWKCWRRELLHAKHAVLILANRWNRKALPSWEAYNQPEAIMLLMFISFLKTIFKIPMNHL